MPQRCATVCTSRKDLRTAGGSWYCAKGEMVVAVVEVVIVALSLALALH